MRLLAEPEGRGYLMKWLILSGALMLAACNVSKETADGGVPLDSGLLDSGEAGTDAETPDASSIDCNAAWGNIVGDAEKARETLRECADDSDCTLVPFDTKCLMSSTCPMAVSTTGEAEFKTALDRISGERCTDEMIKDCGFAAGDCPRRYARCEGDLCTYTEESPDAGSRDSGAVSPDAGFDGGDGGYVCPEFLSLVDTAARSMDTCITATDCVKVFIDVGCLSGCFESVATAQKADFEAAMRQIAAQYCTEEVKAKCGMGHITCMQGDPSCDAGHCTPKP